MPSVARHVTLIGYRGSGKSSVGRILATRLGRDFVDTDREIERIAAASIRQIFERQGEPAFRQLEHARLLDAYNRPACVVSVGGGAILLEPNRIAMRAAGFVAWLTAPVEELARRLTEDQAGAATRPALTELPMLEEIRTVLNSRAPLYRTTAHAEFSTDSRTVDEVAASICAAVQTFEAETAQP